MREELKRIQHIDAAVLTAYDLEPPIELFTLPQQGNSTQNLGVNSGSGEYILRIHTVDADAIHYEHSLLQWLAGRNLTFNVPVPIPNLEGQTFLYSQQGLQSLAVRLPGVRANRHDPAQVEMMGSALGELHRELAHYPKLSRPCTNSMAELQHAHSLLPEPFALTPRHLSLELTPANDHLLGWWREELIQLKGTIEEFYLRLPRQIIHHDFIPNNVLIHVGNVSAILDFEFATYDVRILDIAIALRNMIRVWEDAEPWETVNRLCTGYKRWIKLYEEEIHAIPSLMQLRNIWLAIKRVGRALAMRDSSLGLQQIEYAQQFSHWRLANEKRLTEQLQMALL